MPGHGETPARKIAINTSVSALDDDLVVGKEQDTGHVFLVRPFRAHQSMPVFS